MTRCPNCDKPDCIAKDKSPQPRPGESPPPDWYAKYKAWNKAKRDCKKNTVDWRAMFIQVSAFAAAVLKQSRDELGDVGGDFIQDEALALGLLETVHMGKACGESCRCIDYDDFPQDCIRYSDLGSRIQEERKDQQ